MARFYDVRGEYAGATFTQLRPFDPMDVTVSDLLATTMLSVRIKPGAARRILHEGGTRDRILSKLNQIPVDCELSCAGSEQFAAMADLYEAVKKALSASTTRNPNAWVTASKLCARKRPQLFPVRDRQVCDHLDLTRLANYQADWQIFKFLVSDSDVLESIAAAVDGAMVIADKPDLRFESSRLRLLDAAVWTYKKFNA